MEHPRERVLRRVPEGAGEPAGEHRRGPREHVRLHGRAGHVAAADLHGLLRGHAARDARNENPANYTAAQFTTSAWYNNLSMYSPSLTGIAGTGTNGLQNGLGLGTSLDVNRQAAGLPINFFMANPAIAQGSAYLESTAGNTRFNALQIDLAGG